MNIQSLVDELQHLGYSLCLDGQNLRYRHLSPTQPRIERAAPLLEALRRNKGAVIEYLSQSGNVATLYKGAQLPGFSNSENQYIKYDRLSTVENPLPYFEKVFAEVTMAIREECRQRKCSYAELLEDIRKIDPAIIERFFELHDAIACDVYGRWCDGSLTVEKLQDFYRTLEEWQVLVIEMLKTK